MKDLAYIEANNVYVKNYDEIKNITWNGEKVENGVQLDIYDKNNKLKHDDLARAEYLYWLSVKVGVPELLSVPDKNLLKENGYKI